jgi:hypothetical protein
MNQYQCVWWEQAKSDHEMFVVCRREGFAQCHSLHYLQMATEKLAKAYFWRSNTPPPKSHAGFVQFLRFLGAVRNDRDRIADSFSFKRFEDFQTWIKSTLPIAYELEHLTPDLASDGPNPEYPWPHSLPSTAPVHHHFQIWEKLVTGQGRSLMRVIQIAIVSFPQYADA